MNNLINNINLLQIETLKNLKNSKSLNTLRAYNSDYRNFNNFCQRNGFISLPADPKIIALYLTYLSKFHKYSTLKRRIASISVIHKLRGYYLDVKNPIIIDNLRGIKNSIGVRQKSKKPILINHLKQIINLINQEKCQLKIILRNKALILLGFAGGFRRTELVNINYEDLEFVTEGLKILIKKSKTDQIGEGNIKAIPYFDNKEFCPVIALKNYMKYRFEKQKTGRVFEISDKLVAIIIKKYIKLSGSDPAQYAGHSLRSGFATTAAEFGAEERSIMAMTGHKTTQMVRRYIKESNLFTNNALNKIKI